MINHDKCTAIARGVQRKEITIYVGRFIDSWRLEVEGKTSDGWKTLHSIDVNADVALALVASGVPIQNWDTFIELLHDTVGRDGKDD